MKETVTETVFQFHSWDDGENCGVPYDLTEAIAWFQGKLAEIPPDHRATARIEIASDYESSGAELTITYKRMETDEEYAERVKREQAYAQARAFEQEQRERAALAALKRKYEGA